MFFCNRKKVYEDVCWWRLCGVGFALVIFARGWGGAPVFPSTQRGPRPGPRPPPVTILSVRFGAQSYGLGGFPRLGLLRTNEPRIRAWVSRRYTRANAILWSTGPLGRPPLRPPARARPPPPAPTPPQPALPAWGPQAWV